MAPRDCEGRAEPSAHVTTRHTLMHLFYCPACRSDGDLAGACTCREREMEVLVSGTVVRNSDGTDAEVKLLSVKDSEGRERTDLSAKEERALEDALYNAFEEREIWEKAEALHEAKSISEALHLYVELALQSGTDPSLVREHLRRVRQAVFVPKAVAP